MINRLYQMCTRCVMDTSDPEILFDEKGICNHCMNFDQITSKRWFPNEEGKRRLESVFSMIRAGRKHKEYDCIIGLSGGVDSTYLAVVLKNYNLRPLVVHVDAGWNSEIAVHNIEQAVKYCGYTLHTHVMDWDEIRDIQVAYLKAGVSNQDVPQDHAFFASLYHFAVKNKIKYVISGGNIATESVFPSSWHHSAMDAINLHAIHNKFGGGELQQYKTINIFQYYFYYPLIYKMRTVRPLNYMKYNKKDAIEFLKKEIGYKEYGRKHGESIFTKFFQNYYLPKKFGYDKRKPHLSSMILSGQITREKGLLELSKPLYEKNELEEDIDYIANKLQISNHDLEFMINSPGIDYSEYKNWDKIYNSIKKLQYCYEKITGKDIKNYA